jgi:hypothetical protein
VIFAAALVYKTRISRSRESEDYSDSSCGGEDNGARPDHHGNNSSTRGLSETGYIVGRDVTVEARMAEGQYDRLPALAADLANKLARKLEPLRTQARTTMVMPVTLPPGWLRLATRPAWTGSKAATKTTGIDVVAAFAANVARGPDAVRASGTHTRRVRRLSSITREPWRNVIGALGQRWHAAT